LVSVQYVELYVFVGLRLATHDIAVYSSFARLWFCTVAAELDD